MDVSVLKRTDSVIRKEGMMALLNCLGEVDAERFISLVIHEPFDYTNWQRGLFENESLESLNSKAMEFVFQNN